MIETYITKSHAKFESDIMSHLCVQTVLRLFGIVCCFSCFHDYKVYKLLYFYMKCVSIVY